MARRSECIRLISPIDDWHIIISMIRTAVALLILSVAAIACTVFPTVYKVSPSFSAHVKNDLGTVAGLRLKVSRFKEDEFQRLTDEQQRSADPNTFEEVIAESVTDSTGTAHFNLYKTGTFTLSAESPANSMDWIELDVADESPSQLIELQWPSVKILRTSHIRGKLMKGLFSSDSEPVKNNALKLHGLIDYRDLCIFCRYSRPLERQPTSTNLKAISRSLFLPMIRMTC